MFCEELLLQFVGRGGGVMVEGDDGVVDDGAVFVDEDGFGGGGAEVEADAEGGDGHNGILNGTIKAGAIIAPNPRGKR